MKTTKNSAVRIKKVVHGSSQNWRFKCLAYSTALNALKRCTKTLNGQYSIRQLLPATVSPNDAYKFHWKLKKKWKSEIVCNFSAPQIPKSATPTQSPQMQRTKGITVHYATWHKPYTHTTAGAQRWFLLHNEVCVCVCMRLCACVALLPHATKNPLQ